ncbi:hypothetical protein JTE90_007511 [Oedothorax gibbosus]|uniref:Uncharacterized protein n=1 Tax=Oedothorax gibbosus TaxID=931172 RepID=A0AAV6VM12_9ARAC|nr:hypothetical protein JTE90_007511 [Oedothorax gibbosus]
MSSQRFILNYYSHRISGEVLHNSYSYARKLSVLEHQQEIGTEASTSDRYWIVSSPSRESCLSEKAASSEQCDPRHLWPNQ